MKSSDKDGTEPLSGLEEGKAGMSQAELVNHERTYSRMLLAASK